MTSGWVGLDPLGPPRHPRPVLGSRSSLALVAVVTLACAPEEPDYAACADAPTLGVPGDVAIESQGVSWAWTDGWSEGAPVTVRVPTDLTGLTVIVDDGHASTGVSRVLLGDDVLLDTAALDPGLEGLVAPFFHVPTPAGAVTFPMSADSALRAGCLTVTPVALEDLSGEASGRLTFVSRRRPAGGSISIDAIVVGPTAIERADLETAFATVAAVYAEAGSPGLAGVTYHTLDRASAFVVEEGVGLENLRASAVEPDDPLSIHVFFVQDFTVPGTLGFAASIPGPNGVSGTAGSGLVISVDSHLSRDGTTVDAVLMGETIAHEIGHQLGLFHPTESDGLSFDVLEDTPECHLDRDLDADGEVSAEECLDAGARNLMFWVAGDGLRQRELSPTQVRILSLAPVAR